MAGAKFICGRADVGTGYQMAFEQRGTVVTSEIGFIPKMLPELTEEQRQEIGEFLQALEEKR